MGVWASGRPLETRSGRKAGALSSKRPLAREVPWSACSLMPAYQEIKRLGWSGEEARSGWIMAHVSMSRDAIRRMHCSCSCSCRDMSCQIAHGKKKDIFIAFLVDRLSFCAYI